MKKITVVPTRGLFIYLFGVHPTAPVCSLLSKTCGTALPIAGGVADAECLPDHDGISATERYTNTNTMGQKSFSQKDMVTWVPRVENGFALLPETPGIGCDLVPDVEKRFPFKRRTINTRLSVDGSIVDQ